MSQGLSFISEFAPFDNRQTAKREFAPVDVAEVAAPRGRWILPAVDKVRLGLILSDYSANWHSSRGLLSIDVSAGSLSICEFNEPRRMEMRNPANIALVHLQNETLEQALRDNTRQPRIEVQERHGLQDHNMRRLMEILLHEKRQGFPSGTFFLDSIAAALAGHLIHYYSAGAPLIAKSVGGMAPSTLRRCIALMEARLEGDLRLDELACQAGLSTSHFIRSFRQSTGKTPYQFLLDWRVQRAQTLMRNPHFFIDRGCQVEWIRQSASHGPYFPICHGYGAKRLSPFAVDTSPFVREPPQLMHQKTVRTRSSQVLRLHLTPSRRDSLYQLTDVEKRTLKTSLDGFHYCKLLTKPRDRRISSDYFASIRCALGVNSLKAILNAVILISNRFA